MQTHATRLSLAILLSLALTGFSLAQPPPADGQRRGGGMRGGGGMMMMGGGGGNAGQVTAINGADITVKTMTGAQLTVKTSEETRFFGKDRTPIALKDIKVGDYIMAGGAPQQEGAVTARFVGQLDEAGVKRLQDFQANLGKTVIAGEIKSIDETKLTIARPDGQTQQIELDESTSLKRGRDESITLADVKAGDRVYGEGELKNGVFVPRELHVMAPGMRRQRGAEPAEGAAPNAAPQGNTAPQAPPKESLFMQRHFIPRLRVGVLILASALTAAQQPPAAVPPVSAPTTTSASIIV